MTENNLTETNTERYAEVEAHLPSVGLGAMRTSATYIALLLYLEGNMAVDVLVSAAKELKISLEDITAEWNDKPCTKCGMSLLVHDELDCKGYSTKQN